MTNEQIILFAILGGVLVLLLWGRVRYDIVAFTALLIAVILGTVETDNAFSGFGHPATVIIAIVLVISRGLELSGAVALISRAIIDAARSVASHIAIFAAVAAGLSAVMNNVAALALLMPVDMQAAKKSGRSPALTLMPLSFATILGGMITLIGTPPNIIIGQFRGRALGEPFSMFDFAPVGIACAVAGVAFIALIGWRLLPRSLSERKGAQEAFSLDGYIAELIVGEESKAVGRTVAEIEPEARENDVRVIGILRSGKRVHGGVRKETLEAGDILVVEGGPDGLKDLTSTLDLSYAREDQRDPDDDRQHGEMVMVEAVVPKEARIESRTTNDFRLWRRFGSMLVGVARQGTRFRSRPHKLPIRAGDVLLLYGPAERMDDVIHRLGALPLADRGLRVPKRGTAAIAIGVFAAAIALASFGVLYLPVALALAATILVLLQIIPLREIYDSIEWPVIVLLGSLIPIGAAFEDAGGTALLATGLVGATEGAPAWVVMAALLVITMTLSDVLNNTATAIIAAPLAIDVAGRVGANPDSFLMAVAIGASCAFLTPIGHKNNTLVLGPGGYKFSDYWRMGLPLEIVIVAVAVPAILVFWPL